MSPDSTTTSPSHQADNLPVGIKAPTNYSSVASHILAQLDVFCPIIYCSHQLIPACNGISLDTRIKSVAVGCLVVGEGRALRVTLECIGPASWFTILIPVYL